MGIADLTGVEGDLLLVAAFLRTTIGLDAAAVTEVRTRDSILSRRGPAVYGIFVSHFFADYGRGPPDPHYNGPPPPPALGYPPDNYGPGGGPHHGPPQREVRRDRRGRPRDEGPPGVSLLVRNVTGDINTNDLQMAFGRIGDVRDVYIPRDFHSQQPKGFAFIEYATPAMAQEARNEMDRFVIKGRELEVVFAQERRKTPNEMRGRVVEGSSRGGSSRDRGSRDRGSHSFER